MQHTKVQTPGFWFDGIALIRIVLGVMLIVHGLQLFQSEEMAAFSEFLRGRIPYPDLMPYAGKMIELGGGFLLLIGLFTRLATILLFCTFLFITFVMGEGKILGENQHPFLLALFSLMFFFTGAGRLSIDHVLLMNRKDDTKDTGASISKRFGRYVSKS